MHVRMAGCEPRSQLVSEQCKLRSWKIAEDGHAVFLERRHHLAQSANPGLGVDRGSVAHLGKWWKRFHTRRIRKKRELTIIGPSLQALIALTTLGSTSDDHPVADLYT